MRIDVATDAFPADPTRDYALVPGSDTRDEVFANGVRNLNHASFDPETKDLWFGDSGQDFWEEINRLYDGQVVKMTGLGRQTNFGWNHYESNRIINGFPGISGCCQTSVYSYAHGTGPDQGSSVIGGYVYRGPIPALRGEYFFADAVAPNLWSFALADVPLSAGTVGFPAGVPASAVKRRNTDLAPNVGSYTNISGFGTDASGNLFILDGDGEVFMIEGR